MKNRSASLDDHHPAIELLPLDHLVQMWQFGAMPNEVDPRILKLCDQVTAKRARTVIEHILEHGQVTTEELRDVYGYDHPPRAARDVREEGIPLVTFSVRSPLTGRQIGAYRFGDPSEIKRGRIGGRKAFSKAFRDRLIAYYDSRDAVTREKMDPRYLQIDHRVPYEVAGDTAHDETKLEEYMLLDASSQRAKSWSCEQCSNWQQHHDDRVCRLCFWAFPHEYTHVAGERVRRVHIEWRGAEVDVFERLRTRAEHEDTTVGALLKQLAKRIA